MSARSFATAIRTTPERGSSASKTPHNRGGGAIFPLADIQDIASLCQSHGLRLHMDGARFWNACVATGISEADYAAPFDTVSVCFSKGLGAPVGSALVGSADLIHRARRFRKMLGGGMRQAGIIAAGALYALEHQRERLAVDHDNARLLAAGLAELDEITLDLATVQTNIVVFATQQPASDVVKQLAQRGVAMLSTGPYTVRAVTNLMVSSEQIEDAIAAVKAVLVESQALLAN